MFVKEVTIGPIHYISRWSNQQPVTVAKWVARQTAEQDVGSSNPSIPPLLKHACGEGDWLLCWHYTLAKVSHQRWILGNIYYVRLCQTRIRQNPLWLWNPEETSPEVQNRGISGPTNGHVSNKNLKKKKSNQHQQTRKISSTVISIPLHYHQRLRVLNIGYILNETNTHVCM